MSTATWWRDHRSRRRSRWLKKYKKKKVASRRSQKTHRTERRERRERERKKEEERKKKKERRKKKKEEEKEEEEEEKKRREGKGGREREKEIQKRNCAKNGNQVTRILESKKVEEEGIAGRSSESQSPHFGCCYFSDKSSTLEDAEKAMLELYCERCQLKDGHTVLDIGCGWGSLSLYIARKYSNCKITGICNSRTQKAYIEEQCRVLELQNVEIILADISTFEMEASYDWIFSIGMFEHMKNYRDLLKKISTWMKQDGLLFVDHFCHKTFAYHFEETNEDDWITKYFFSGGTMPSTNLLLYFQDDVSVADHWLVNGKHYAQTSEEWLKRMDQNVDSIKPIMEATYGNDQAVKWTVYWRTFFISVAELFGYNDGEEWMVAHFLFKKKN